MGMTINREIKTVLTHEDIALIAAMAYGYQNYILGPQGEKAHNEDLRIHSIRLVNRLGTEMGAYPINDFTRDPDGRQKVDDNGLKLMEEMVKFLDQKPEPDHDKVSRLRYKHELIEDVNAYIRNAKKTSNGKQD